jgi:hypothetical protein
MEVIEVSLEKVSVKAEGHVQGHMSKVVWDKSSGNDLNLHLDRIENSAPWP